MSEQPTPGQPNTPDPEQPDSTEPSVKEPDKKPLVYPPIRVTRRLNKGGDRGEMKG
jgi:hypothetical protein